jgi:hypothetical protein
VPQQWPALPPPDTHQLASMGKKGTKRKNPGVGIDFKRAKHKVKMASVQYDHTGTHGLNTRQQSPLVQ